MPDFSKNCDVYQGYNFKKDKQSTVGFITALKIDKDSLTADQKCKDPTNPETDISAVAVLSGFSWSTGLTDSLLLSGQVTTANRQKIAELLLKSMTNIEVDLKFDVYEYDPKDKKYFKCVAAETELKALIEKQGGDLALDVAQDCSHEVQSPENFAFNVAVKPQPSVQQIELAVSTSGKISKPWGVAAT